MVLNIDVLGNNENLQYHLNPELLFRSTHANGWVIGWVVGWPCGGLVGWLGGWRGRTEVGRGGGGKGGGGVEECMMRVRPMNT